MFITTDSYYSIDQYNEFKSALTNNGVSFKEYINIKTPFRWYFEVPYAPIMVNYDVLPEKEQRWLVSKVQPLKPDEEYLLYRKESQDGPKNLPRFIYNKPLTEAIASDYAVFFNAPSKEIINKITKELPGLKVYYFGRYFGDRYRLCLCTNKLIRNYLTMEMILLEKSKEHNEIGRFESELNYRIFKNKDKLRKYTQTPYYMNGQYFPPDYKGDRDSKNLSLN